MLMRVSVGIHLDDLESVRDYDLMSKKFFTHATPTLFNAGTPQMSFWLCKMIVLTGYTTR
jgi:ribonucleoside-diphosphate reductase alpha chain